jgi:hypothetical protein
MSRTPNRYLLDAEFAASRKAGVRGPRAKQATIDRMRFPLPRILQLRKRRRDHVSDQKAVEAAGVIKPHFEKDPTDDNGPTSKSRIVIIV